LDGRVQELPVQPRRWTLRECGPWRPDRAEGDPHQAEVQVIQVVHGGGGLRFDEDLSADRSAGICSWCHPECGESEPLPGHHGQKEAQQDGHVRVCQRYKDPAENAILGAELETRLATAAKEGVP